MTYNPDLTTPITQELLAELHGQNDIAEDLRALGTQTTTRGRCILKITLLCEDCGVTGQCDCPRPWASAVGDVIFDIRNAIEQEGGEPHWFIPDEFYIETLKVGDLTLDNFGRVSEVTDIIYRNETCVKFYTSYGYNGAKVSGNLEAERLTRTIPLHAIFNHVELDNLEYELLRRLMLEADG